MALQKYSLGTIPIHDIDLCPDIELGKGKIGTVYAGKLLTIPVAFKKFNYQRNIWGTWKIILKSEIRNLCHLSHPNVVKIYGAVLDKGSVGIVMERLQYSLYKAMFVEEIHFSGIEKMEIIKQVSEGLKYLHSLEIAHCNLTSENIILSASKLAKIGNYGPKFVRSTTMSDFRSTVGEIDHRYAPPEIRPLNIRQLKKCDIYSLGILVFEVFEARPLHEDIHSDILSLIENPKHSSLVNHIPPPILSIAIFCWEVDSNRRPSIEEFLMHWNSLYSDNNDISSL